MSTRNYSARETESSRVINTKDASSWTSLYGLQVKRGVDALIGLSTNSKESLRPTNPIWNRMRSFWFLPPRSSRCGRKVRPAKREFSRTPGQLFIPLVLLAFPTLGGGSSHHVSDGVEQGQPVVWGALAISLWILRELGAPLCGIVMGTSTVGWLTCQIPLPSSTSIRDSFGNALTIVCFTVMISSSIVYICAQCMLYQSCDKPPHEIRHMVRDYVGRTIALVLTLTVGLFTQQGSAITPHTMITCIPAFFSLSSFVCSLFRPIEWVPDLEQPRY